MYFDKVSIFIKGFDTTKPLTNVDLIFFAPFKYFDDYRCFNFFDSKYLHHQYP